MCTCASCKHTDALAGLPDLLGLKPHKRYGFKDWPRGDPAGKRASEHDYRVHVGHCNAFPDYVPLEKTFPQRFPYSGIAPIRQNVEAVRWNAGRKWPGAVTPQVSPAQPAKAAPHLPALDRQREPGKIYAMVKPARKRSRGRPAIPGRNILIKLDERLIAKARKLGGGGARDTAKGIRRALEAA